MSTRPLLKLIGWSAMHPLSMGFAVAVLTLTGIVSPDGLDVVATGLLVYAGASLAALVTVLGRRGSWAATRRLTRSQMRQMRAAALANLVYVIAFWIAVFGVAPIAAVTAGPLRVPLEVFFGKLLLRDQPRRATRCQSLAALGDIALAGSIVALSAWHSAGGAMGDLLLSAAVLAVLVVSNAATEVLRLRISQPQGNSEAVAPALVILVNSVVAMAAFSIWGLVEAGPGGLMVKLHLDQTWLFGGALIVGTSGVWLSQYAKSQAVMNGLTAQKAARLALSFAAASIVATLVIQALTLYALPHSVIVPWIDQMPIWLDEARQLEILVSLAVAWLVVAGIIRQK